MFASSAVLYLTRTGDYLSCNVSLFFSNARVHGASLTSEFVNACFFQVAFASNDVAHVYSLSVSSHRGCCVGCANVASRILIGKTREAKLII